MNNEPLNRWSIRLAGLGTGFLAYGILSDNLRFSRPVTLALGAGMLLVGAAAFLLTRQRKSR